MYDGLACFYDKYTGDMNHAKVAQFLLKCFVKYGNDGLKKTASGVNIDGTSDGTDPRLSKLVIDVGCGTGKLTEILCEKGFDMTGLDVSPEMLFKARERNPDILWLLQDMTKMDTYGSYAAMISTFDAVNHLTTTKKLRSFFTRAINFVDPGGLLIFDFLTEDYFKENVDGKILLDDSDDGTLIWQGKYNAKTGVCKYEITCYGLNEDGTYERLDDTVTEKAWSQNIIVSELENAGFVIKKIYEGKRTFVVAKKPKGAKNG